MSGLAGRRPTVHFSITDGWMLTTARAGLTPFRAGPILREACVGTLRASTGRDVVELSRGPDVQTRDEIRLTTLAGCAG